MKRVLIFPLLFAFLIIALIVGILWWRNASTPVSSEKSFKSFVIEKGSTAAEIASKLEDGGFIKSSLAFRVYTQLTGKSKGILAGEYRLSPHMSLVEIVSELGSGPRELWVTVPEGLRREEVAEKFIAGLEKQGEDAENFRKEFLKESTDSEGFLFPDTYLFPKEATASAVVTKMKATFNRRIDDFSQDIEKSELTLNEIVTLASVLERETKTDSERPIVAGVLLNRLRIGMGLQADATVQYAVANSKLKTQNSRQEGGQAKLEKYWEPLTRDDLDINSPYNTYRFKGLPPGPIANPGLSSLKAAINPSETDYFYYLHDSSGGIHFAKTLEAHNENVRKYLGK